MKSAARSISSVSIIPAALAAAIALCLIAWAPRAHAASLTQDQLDNVQSLLSSYGVSDAKIQAVTAVLSDNGQANGQQMGSSTPCAIPSRALMRGMRSEDVKTLQERLSEDGYLSQDDVSGFFGSTTQAAVKQWQADRGIVASGTPETTGFGMIGRKSLDELGKCEVHRMERGDNQENGDASSTPGMMPHRGEGGDHGRGEHGNQPLNGGTPIPQSNSSDQGAAAVTAMTQFAQDYSDAFNENMAAVVSAPYQLIVNSVSDWFASLGVQ